MVALKTWILACAISGTGQTALLDFSSPYCGPCRQMEPTIARLEAAGYPVTKIDVSQNPQRAQQYGVNAVPCFVMLRDGREVGRIQGRTSYANLQRLYQLAGFTPADNRKTDNRQMVRAQSPDPRNTIVLTPKLAPAVQPTPQFANGGVRQVSAPATSVNQRSRSITAQQLAMRATVRLKVEDARGFSYGTGTIIDTHGEEALVLTCGHIFRDSDGKGRINVDLVGLAGGGQIKTVQGQLIAYDCQKRDIGLVAIRPGIVIEPAPVAPDGYRPTRGLKVFAIGCDRGGPSQLIESRITSLNRYQGPPNIQATGRPVDGRSGGGLFSQEGYLIGVCNLADPVDNEGIYAALEVVHDQLTRIGHEQIFRRGDTSLAAAEPARQPVPQKMAPRAADDRRMLTGNFSPPAMPKSMPRQRGLEQQASFTKSAPLAALANGEATEVICIVRTRNNPQGEVIVLDRPSPQLLDRIARESYGDDPDRPIRIDERSGGRAIATVPRRAPLTSDADSRGILRGQSAD